jgi:hypothetical protein
VSGSGLGLVSVRGVGYRVRVGFRDRSGSRGLCWVQRSRLTQARGSYRAQDWVNYLLVRGSRGVGFRILEFSWVLAEWVSGFVYGLTFGISRLGVRVGLWEVLGLCRFGGLWCVCGFGLVADSWVLAEWVSGFVFGVAGSGFVSGSAGARVGFGCSWVCGYVFIHTQYSRCFVFIRVHTSSTSGLAGCGVSGSCCVHGSEWVSGYVLGSAFGINGLLARNLVGLGTGRLWARVGSGGSWGDVVSGS